MVEALIFSEKGGCADLRLLDQRLLPLKTVYLNITGCEDGWRAIKDMAVRGAPAIAIAGALSLATELRNGGAGRQFDSAADAEAAIKSRLSYLVTSRPTAVNLADAAEKLGRVASSAAHQSGTAQAVSEAVISAAKQMLDADIAANKAMGAHGARAIVDELRARGRKTEGKIRLLTHCNTGSLATAGFGTALGVVRTLHQQGAIDHVYCTETRPYNQGARLTAFELVRDGIPATLLTDSAAAALMAAGRVDAAVVGADRVAANGDTANKIGTYSLALCAAHHRRALEMILEAGRIPLFSAAPTTTLDPALQSGTMIEIEERDATELTHHQGAQIAAPGIGVWNPSFDVTPAALLTGIITENGLVPKPAPDRFDVADLLAGTPGKSEEADNDIHSSIPGFYALGLSTVKDYLAERPALCDLVGPRTSKEDWKAREVGDGNINYVYIVEGPSGGVVVKQGLPHIRIAQDWPLTQERARIEADALAEEARHCPEHVPTLHHYDARLALVVMQYLPPPHDILRRALVAGRTFPLLSAHVATFLARTLFRTSLLARDSATHRSEAARFGNSELCRLTEQVIFQDPYYDAPMNRHTSPQLDALAARMRDDVDARVAATRLKAVFCERQQALLHGDLHTGSLMVTPETTYAIDAEFAFYGPIAFDVCKMLANLLLAFFASDGLASTEDPRHGQRAWLLRTVEEIWEGFRKGFLHLWDEAVELGSGGDLIPPQLFPAGALGSSAVKAAQEAFMEEVFRDSLSFAGAVMIRRVLGIAHVIDFETIWSEDARAVCEARAVRAGRELLVHPNAFPDIKAVTTFAEKTRQDGQDPLIVL